MKQRVITGIPIGLIFKDGDEYICTDLYEIPLPKSIIDNIINETSDEEYNILEDEMLEQYEAMGCKILKKGYKNEKRNIIKT